MNIRKNLRYLGAATALFGCVSAQATSDPAPTPPMGWNSWNWWGKKAINEQLMRDTIDAMVENGLLEAGYTYFVVDGGWRDVKLGENGELLAHPEKFPSGMKALADYAHSKGFKFGLHTVPGTHDCGGDKVGAWGIEEVHVDQFTEWGIDFIKLDRCKFLKGKEEPKSTSDKRWAAGWEEGNNLYDAYARWSELLENSPRDIVLSASAYKYYDWYPVLTQMGRTTGDIRARVGGSYTAAFDADSTVTMPFLPVMVIADKNNEYADKAGNGYWNDPDMMVTGNQGLTWDQQRVHFALWAIMSSPLILGNDPTHMSEEELEIITNKHAIAVNQDPTEQGRRVYKEGDIEIWLKNLKEGKKAVLLLNRGTSGSRIITLDFVRFNLGRKLTLFDIWKNQPVGSFEDGYSVEVNATSGQFLLLRNSDGPQQGN